MAATTSAKPEKYGLIKQRNKMIRIAWLVVLQILVSVLVVSFLVPFLWMVSSSLKSSTQIFAPQFVFIPANPQWQNFARVFEVMPFDLFIINTVIVVGLAVTGTLISSAMVAYSFARLEWPGRDFFFGLLLATMMLPVIITLVPRFIIFRNLPAFGIQGSNNWLNTFLPLTVPFWLAGTPLYVFLMRQFFRGLPMELEEAALIDGAGRVRILTTIILPLSKPVLATVAVFATLQHYQEFLEPLIYLSSLRKWTLAVGIASLNANESYGASWELVFAAGTIMTLPMLLLFLVAQRYFVQGIAMTGFGGR